MNRTKEYRFEALSVGNYITVSERFQHARVAASEYGRKHNQCYSCRVQPDGTMRVYRVALDQQPIDQRGRRGKRRIDYATDPSKDQFMAWLGTFQVGQSYTMPAHYSHLYLAMSAWVELYSVRSGHLLTAVATNGVLVVSRVS